MEITSPQIRSPKVCLGEVLTLKGSVRNVLESVAGVLTRVLAGVLNVAEWIGDAHKLGMMIGTMKIKMIKNSKLTRKSMIPVKSRRLSIVILMLTLLPLVIYARFVWERPPRTAVQRELFRGVTYQREVRNQPRPIMIHTVGVDLAASGIKVVVSPGVPLSEPSNQARAQTTSEFLTTAQAQIAVNGSFFFPFRENTPWDYFPHSGDRVNVIGEAIAEDIIYAQQQRPWHPVCFLDSGRVLIAAELTCPDTTQFSLSGGPTLLVDGRPKRTMKLNNDETAYGRMVVATNQAGTYLWLIAIDGKQPFYSRGMTLAEVVEFLQELGVENALNLDGGGSTTLVRSQDGHPQLLNSPIHTKIPMLERPVANQIGIYAQPLN